MKKIEAIVRKEKFKEVFETLENSGIGGMTVVPVRGFGRNRNGLSEKMKIEIYADEFQVEETVKMIRQVAKTESTGDGKIAVFDLDKLYRIRTGEEGAGAV